MEHGLNIKMFEQGSLDWRDLIDYVDHATMDGPLASEIAGLPAGIRFKHILQSAMINSLRSIGLTEDDYQNLPDNYFIDLIHIGQKQSKTDSAMQLRRRPDRLSVEEMKQRIGWD